MNISRINRQKGIAQLVVIAVMAFLALGIPTATKLVQQNQENRGKATSNYTSEGTATNVDLDKECGLIKFNQLTQTTDEDNPNLLCKTGRVWQYNLIKPTCSGANCDKLPLSLSQPYYRWYCVKDVDPSLDLNDPTVKQQIIDKVVLCRNINTEIISKTPQCGPINNQVLNEFPSKEKLCTVGTPSEVSQNKTTMVYVWQCRLDDKKVSCSSKSRPVPTLSSKPTVTLSAKTCAGSMTDFDPKISQKWISETTLEVKTQVMTYCGGATISTPTIVTFSNENLALSYQIKVGDVVTHCVCPRELTFTIKNIPQNEYKVTIKENNLSQDNPKCGSAHGQILTTNPNEKELCAAGTPSEVSTNKTTMVRVWSCSQNNKKVSCSSKPVPNKPQVINGVCGPLKANQVTPNIDKERPELLCQSGKIGNFTKTATAYWWDCSGINGGTSTGCGFSVNELKVTPTPGPITNIKISPTSLRLKIGQSQNLTYILTPSNSTDTIKWSTSSEGMIRIQKITYKCNSDTDSRCIDAPGNNHLQITALKAGTVKIKLTTSSNRSAEATIVITDNLTTKPTPPPIISVPKCGSANGQVLNDYPPKEKLCATGIPTEVSQNKTTMVYSWQCQLNNQKVSCFSKNKSEYSNVINGACGTLKYSDITPDINKTNPQLLCKSGKLVNFVGIAPNCITGPNCPPANYSWSCIGTNGGKSVRCTINNTVTTTKPIPATKLRLSPSYLRLRIGQSRNLTYTLTPSNSTDTVKWSTSGDGLVKIEKISPKCEVGTKCITTPGVNQLQITGLKEGRVNLNFVTSSGQKANASIVITKYNIFINAWEILKNRN